MPKRKQAIVHVAQQIKEALQLRVAGYDFTDIGEKTGIGDADEVRALISAEIKGLISNEERRLLKGIELIRLERLWEQVYVNENDDFKPRERVRMLLEISRDRRALAGLDSPKSLDLTSGGEAIKAYIGVSPDDWDAAEVVEVQQDEEETE